MACGTAGAPAGQAKCAGVPRSTARESHTCSMHRRGDCNPSPYVQMEAAGLRGEVWMHVYSPIAAALTVLLLAGSGDAAMVTMRFTGIVGSIDPGPSLPTSLSIGDPFSGSYTYDDS